MLELLALVTGGVKENTEVKSSISTILDNFKINAAENIIMVEK